MTKIVRIPSVHGLLAATLRMPKSETSVGLAILLHGWNSNRQTGRNMMIADLLERQGIGSLALDFSGHGESEGNIELSSVDRQVDEVLAALTYVEQLTQIDKKKIGLVGASIGGSTALATLAEVPEAFRCAVLVAPRLDFSGVAEYEYYFDGPEGRVENREMLRNGKYHDFYSDAAKVKAPTLVIHGTRDEQIPIQQSHKLQAMYPRRFLTSRS